MSVYEELKPCPFCGLEPEIEYRFGRMIIECMNDKCSTRPSTWFHVKTNKVDKLIKSWNKRK